MGTWGYLLPPCGLIRLNIGISVSQGICKESHLIVVISLELHLPHIMANLLPDKKIVPKGKGGSTYTATFSTLSKIQCKYMRAIPHCKKLILIQGALYYLFQCTKKISL